MWKLTVCSMFRQSFICVFGIMSIPLILWAGPQEERPNEPLATVVQENDGSEADQAAGSKSESTVANAKEGKADELKRVSVAVARDRARVMHEIYVATLDVMHDRYFHADRAVVPARAMEDVFSEIQRQSGAQAQWISVNLRAMNIDHEPKSDFQKKAAREIAGGSNESEIVEDGFYRRAGSIRLASGCISCHGGFFSEPPKGPKFAGLIISIPVNGDAAGNDGN